MSASKKNIFIKRAQCVDSNDKTGSESNELNYTSMNDMTIMIKEDDNENYLGLKSRDKNRVLKTCRGSTLMLNEQAERPEKITIETSSASVDYDTNVLRTISTTQNKEECVIDGIINTKTLIKVSSNPKLKEIKDVTM